MNTIKTILLGISFFISALSYADIVVITHPDNTQTLTKSEIRQIFLGQRKVFPDGRSIEMFDLAEKSPEKAYFSKKVLRKSISSLNSYWSRMLFASQSRPPKSLKNAAEAVEVVSANKSAIAYVNIDDINNINKNVHVMLTITE